MALYRGAVLVVYSAVFLAALASVASAAYAPRITRASGTYKVPTNAASFYGSSSSSGRFIAFQSLATRLAGGGVDMDVFLRDAWSGETRLVSHGPGGSASDGYSGEACMTPSGRFVAYASVASNIVPGDTNADYDVFVWDAMSDETTRASLSGVGGDSHTPSISDDGRYVAFVSEATDLVDGDANGFQDVFIRDLVSQTTTRVSSPVGGLEANGDSSAPSISADGRKVAFVSKANNLVPGDTNSAADVFVRDLDAGTLVRVSVSYNGSQGTQGSWAPVISGNGAKVAFESLAPNLVRDTNGLRDVFVRDLLANTTIRVSVTATGGQGNRESNGPSISSDGRYVAFASASTFVTGDTNTVMDIFVRDTVVKTTRRVSVQDSTQASRGCGGAHIDRTGRRVVFHTVAGNLVVGDSNGVSDVLQSSFGPRAYGRIAGTSVYGTSARASAASVRTASTVVVANGRNWYEALSASSLAGVLRAPLLLTSGTSLPTEVRDEIVRLGATRAYIVGPTTSVSSAVASQVSSATANGPVTRVGGSDRYATSAAVASLVVKLRGTGYDGKILVVNGGTANASLAAVPLAVSSGRPFVLVNPKTGNYRLPAGTKRATILGTTSQVSTKVENRLRSTLGKTRVRRIGSTDRYAMASAIAAWAVSEARLTWDGVTIVNLSRPTEAISGATMAGRAGTVVLAAPATSLPLPTKSRLTANRGRINLVRVTGSSASISSKTVSAIKKALGG